MNKVTTIEAAMEHVHDGQVIMFGGFMTVGTPVKLIDAILEKGVKDITVCMQLTDYCPHRGLGEKPSLSGEDFSMLAVWRTTGNQATPLRHKISHCLDHEIPQANSFVASSGNVTD